MVDSELYLNIANFVPAFFQDVLHYALCFSAQVCDSCWSSYYSAVWCDHIETVHFCRRTNQYIIGVEKRFLE